MARNEKKRQKSIQHKTAKRKEKKRSIAHSVFKSYRNEIKAASGWPLHECLISENWKEPGELVQILLARQSPTTAEIGVSLFLVDLGCLGVKDAMTRVFRTRAEYERDLRLNVMARGSFVACTPDLVARILREGIEYARKLGFKPNPDYHDAVLLVGGDPDASDETVPLGKDGQPFFVSGPFDDPVQVMRKLDKAVGPGNYHFVTLFGEAPDFFDDDDEEGELDEDEFDPFDDFAPLPAAADLPIRKVKLDLEALSRALMEVSDEDRYLDIETGQIIARDPTLDAELESIYGEIDAEPGDEAAVAAKFTELLNARDLPEGMKQALIEADRIDMLYGERYLPFAPYFAIGSILDYNQFVATVEDRKLRDRLMRALAKDDLQSAFQRELEARPDEMQRWLAFAEERRHQNALQFLESWGVEPITQ
jgi:hypothetical protein